MRQLRVIGIFLFVLAMFQLRADNNPIGARAWGMAGVSSVFSDHWSAQNNQGGLGFVKEISAGAFYENRFLLKQLSSNAFATALPVKRGAFGMSYAGFGYAAFRETKAGISYGIALHENFSIGIGINYINLRIGDIYGKYTSVTGEFGFIGKLSKQVIVSGHIYNPTKNKLGSSFNERLPSHIRLGLSYAPSEKVLLAVEAEKGSFAKINIRGGIEYHPLEKFYIRAGASSSPYIASFGFGLKLPQFQFDLSSNWHQVLGFSPQASLSFVFNKTTAEKQNVNE